MTLGMITCNYYMRIYGYEAQEAFDWQRMCAKWRAEFDEPAFLELAAGIRALGYDGLEIWEPTYSHKRYSEARAAALRGRLEGLGFTSIAYCIGGWGAGDVDQVEPAYRFARALGAEVVAGCVPLAEADAILPTVDAMGRKYGIRYAIENHPHPSAESPDEVLALIAPYETVGANVDVGIYHQMGYDAVGAVDRFGAKVYHCHFKDTVRGEGPCRPIGDGDAPMAGVYARLRELGYAGMVSVEFEHPTDPTEGLIKSIGYVRSLG